MRLISMIETYRKHHDPFFLCVTATSSTAERVTVHTAHTAKDSLYGEVVHGEVEQHPICISRGPAP